ncbi:MAG: hypothetical protein WED33_12710 [Bacteroidia bacterium]
MIITLLSFSSCKKEEPKEEPTSVIVGSALLNNVYTTFSRSSFYINDINRWQNFVLLYRNDNSEIKLNFTDPGEGIRFIGDPDSTITELSYKDAGNRRYTADSGSINITKYKFTNGVYYISGGFAFRAKTNPVILPDGTPFFTTIRITDGAFNNLQSTD